MSKKNKIIIGIAAGLVVTAIALVIALTRENSTVPDGNPEPEESTTPGITANIPIDKIPANTDNPDSDDTENELVIEVDGGDSDSKKIDGIGDIPAEKADNPVRVQPPEAPIDGNGSVGDAIDGYNYTPPKYSCGAKNHNCESAEYHAFITNLELEGCVYCGSKSCASFYAVNKWGNTAYDPSKCPKYSAKNDPVKYCQDCGKKTGDGKNGTCEKFTVNTKCPLCGESVKAKTCHTCK